MWCQWNVGNVDSKHCLPLPCSKRSLRLWQQARTRMADTEWEWILRAAELKGCRAAELKGCRTEEQQTIEQKRKNGTWINAPVNDRSNAITLTMHKMSLYFVKWSNSETDFRKNHFHPHRKTCTLFTTLIIKQFEWIVHSREIVPGKRELANYITYESINTMFAQWSMGSHCVHVCVCVRQ